MKQLDLYGRVRHAILIGGMSRREASRVFGIDPRTVAKMLAGTVKLMKLRGTASFGRLSDMERVYLLV
jgi:hypothetical protein